MNITIDIFGEGDKKDVDHLGNLVEATRSVLDMDISQLLVFTEVAFNQHVSVANGVFDVADVQAVRAMNSRNGPDSKISPCFKDFSKLPALITPTDTLEDFL